MKKSLSRQSQHGASDSLHPCSWTDRIVSIIEFQLLKITSKRTIAVASDWHHICISPPLKETPYDLPAARPGERTTLWWCDNILDSKRLFPVHLFTRITFRVTSIRFIGRWISRAKDVGSKALFKPSREWRWIFCSTSVKKGPRSSSKALSYAGQARTG